MSDNKVRTRIAPSPTGFPHLGSIYSALFNKAFAIQNNGTLIWRSEDTDRKRYVEGAEGSMDEALKWFALEADEDPFKGGPFAPYRQSDRLEIYQKYADELIKKGHAYYCFCSEERLVKLREEAAKLKKNPMYDRHCLSLGSKEIEDKLKNNEAHVIRMKVPRDRKIICKDVLRGDIIFDTNTVDDQILIKSDGYPTYHLAVVVDDHLMKITHVIRGHEWLPSYPKHQILFEMLGFELPVFAHFPSLLSMEVKGKLSKRHGHSNVSWYRTKGFLPDAILNFIALLGWSHPDEKEIFSFDEFIQKFRLEDISTNLPKFDLVKLEWMNGEYLRMLPDDVFFDKVKEWLEYVVEHENEEKLAGHDHIDIGEYRLLLDYLTDLDSDKTLLWAMINKERIKKFDELVELNSFFITDQFDNGSILNQLVKYRSGAEVKAHLEWVLSAILRQAQDDKWWSLENLKKIELQIKDKASELNWKVLEVFYPIRIAITGKAVSPPLFESIYILGKEKSLDRLNKFLSLLDNNAG